MISFSAAPLRASQAFVPRDQVVVAFCSAECVLHQVPAEARAARLSSGSEQPLLVTSDRLFLNVSSRAHPPGHPLHGAQPPQSPERRAGWLRKLVGAKLQGVVEVHAVCDCTLCIALISGPPLVDAGTRPPWLLALAPADRRDAASALTLRQLFGVLSDLATGLDLLHQQGLVHGDPFSSNAMVTQDGRGLWVDLNGVHPLTDELRALDIWGFALYALIAASAAAPTWNRKALEAALGELNTTPLAQCLSRMAGALRLAAEADEAGAPVDDAAIGELAQLFAGCGLERREDLLGQVHRRASSVGLVRAFTAFQWNRQCATRWETLFEAERVRHRLVEQELNRTLTQRYQGQLDELRGWIAELEKAKAWNSEQRVSWEAESNRLRALLQAEGQHNQTESQLRQAETRRLEAELERLHQLLKESGIRRRLRKLVTGG